MFECVHLIYEGDENHCLPFLLLAIEIGLEIWRIVLDDWGIFAGHQVLHVKDTEGNDELQVQDTSFENVRKSTDAVSNTRARHVELPCKRRAAAPC